MLYHAMEYCLAINSNEVLIHSATWMNLGNVLSEGNQTQKSTYCMIPFIWNVQKRQIHTDKKQISGWQGLRGRGNEEGIPNGYEVYFWGDGNVMELNSECTICHWIAHFRVMSFILCVFYHTKKKRVSGVSIVAQE